jgi:diguanylate cyclase (GGDEF)-like protein
LPDTQRPLAAPAHFISPSLPVYRIDFFLRSLIISQPSGITMPHSESTEPRWNALLRITRSWRLEWGLDTLLGRVAKEAVEFLELSRGIVYILTPEGLSVQSVWPSVATDAQLKKAAAQSREVAEKVVHTGRPVFAHVMSKSRRSAQINGAGSHSVFCVPLTANRGILGALYVDSHETLKGLNQQDLEFLEMLGLQAAAALEHALLHQSAITDPLTRLYTHRQFQQETEQAVRRAQRSGQPVSLLILDLDHFKELNDTCGHEAGNACLIQVAEKLRDSVRSSDVIARFGGDEFEILLPDTRAVDAVKVAEKIRRTIETLRFAGKRRVTATLGVAAWPENSGDAQTLFLRADEALYHAKEAGRNRTIRSKLAAQKLSAKEQRAKSTAAGALERITPLLRHNATPISSSALKAVRTETIDGHALVRRLGMGSMGEVLLVRQPELKREVALKRPLTGHLTSDQVAAFEREAIVTASLNHPGVITVLTMGRDSDGRRYYTMKPLNGSSLRKILEQRKTDPVMQRTFTLSRLLEILQRVSETIAYAHQRGVVHLDLTPDNIIVGDFGEVSIIDWGSGTTSNGATRRGSRHKSNLAFLTGSVGSIAPEQLPGSSVRPGTPTDVHALGSMLYEILTGRAAFRRENTHTTLQAVVKGVIEQPDVVAPKAGIDPLLSALCMHALKARAQARPNAAEFSEKLGRFVRRETEFAVTRFGKGGAKIDPREWKRVQGDWRLVKGEWVSGPGHNQFLLWTQPVHGDFRFVCEGWIESIGEIAIVCKQRLENLAPSGGYEFQFGAEWMTCTKLQEMAVIGGLKPAPRVRYRLEVEFLDGWLTCLIDGKKIFEHRELFHRSGNHIGFYTCDAGVHFRPIEIQQQTLGLSVPTMRMADDFVDVGQLHKALGLYSELARRMPSRLEGLEAKFKEGICLRRLGRIPEALKVFASLRNTKLEPFALAEQASLAMEDSPRTNYPRAVRYFTSLLNRFPASEAKWRVIKAGYSRFPKAKTERERQQLLLQVEGLARDTSSVPTMDQIRSQTCRMLSLMNLGEWKAALDDSLKFEKKLARIQRHVLGFDHYLVGAILANGREDLLPRDPYENDSWGRDWLQFQHAWGSASPLHVAVRRGQLKQFIRALERGKLPRRFESTDWMYGLNAYLGAYLAAGDRKRARQAYVAHAAKSGPTRVKAFLLACPAIEAQDEELWAAAQEIHQRLASNHNREDEEVFLANELRWAIEHRDFEGAAKLAHGKQPGDWMLKDGFVLQLLLSGLGVLKSPTPEKMKKALPRRVCGTLLELGEMLLGLRPAEPSAIWPDPGFHPEWRLWLALWLEAKGRGREARRIAAPAHDPRYGLMHSQPAIEALLARTSTTPHR